MLAAGLYFYVRLRNSNLILPVPGQALLCKKFADASAYATLAIQYPDLRQYYVELAKRMRRNPRRPGDVAFSDYFQGNDLLWQKLYGDREKPADWSWKDAQLPPAASP